VTVENGNVTLEGTVESLWKRYLAEDIAWNHIGIVDVKNKLAVASPENTTDKTAVSNIVESIDRNLHVDVDDVDVEVRNGEAIINGTVNSVEAWHAVYNAALFTSGVKKVEDNLLIA
ncbi:MAG TPA: BON domain-containing protein, partial [Balneolaceae bacterium]|nr:BON domain-containing protein [Balneolaceae bacterium]